MNTEPQNRTAERIVAIYLILGVGWILFSDRAGLVMFGDAAQFAWFSLCKGILFVLVTSALLYFLIRRYADQLVKLGRVAKESETKYRTLVETTGTGYVILDPAGKVLDANQEYVRLSGHSTLAEISGRRVTEWTAEYDIARNDAEVRKCLEQGSVNNLEIDYVNRARAYVPVEINATVMPNPEGDRIVTLCREITQRRRAENELQESEKRHRLFTDITSDYVYHCTRTGTDPFRVDWIGGAVERITGYTGDEILAKGCWLSIVHPDDREQVGAEMLRLVPGDTRSHEFRLTVKSGEVRWVREMCRCEAGNTAGVLRLFGAIQDITERKQAERKLKASEVRYRSLFTSMIEGMALHKVSYDRQGIPVGSVLVDLNPSGELLIGADKENIVGMDSADLFAGSLKPYMPTIFRLAERGESLTFEMAEAEGKRLFNVSVFYPEKGTFATLLEDITERKKSEVKILKLAYYDILTGLPNRSLFLDRFKQALARSAREQSRVALIYLDLDHFKVINDTLGHDYGDQLLIQVAQRLRETVRSSDTIARLGGDEFVVLLSNLGEEFNVAHIAQHFLDKLSLPFTISARETYTSASVGIAISPEDGLDSETLMRCADLAMYAAKESGRNGYNFYSKEMNRKAHERMQMETSLRQALEREELYLEFQPIVNVSTKAMVSAEALVRWRHPERGIIMPDAFISTAEESGQIVQLGEWVLRTACSKLQEWRHAGFSPVKLSVNVSGRQMTQSPFTDQVCAIVRETGIDPRLIDLEFTETTLMENIESTVKILRKLKEFDVGIVIDDFGSGYSSLGYLKSFPIDRIKIDRSFVKDVCRNPNDKAIVEAIIAMANKLSLDVIAEGVETLEQSSFLMACGCDNAQGFFFHRPLPEADFIRLLPRTDLHAARSR